MPRVWDDNLWRFNQGCQHFSTKKCKKRVYTLYDETMKILYIVFNFFLLKTCTPLYPMVYKFEALGSMDLDIENSVQNIFLKK